MIRTALTRTGALLAAAALALGVAALATPAEAATRTSTRPWASLTATDPASRAATGEFVLRTRNLTYPVRVTVSVDAGTGTTRTYRTLRLTANGSHLAIPLATGQACGMVEVSITDARGRHRDAVAGFNTDTGDTPAAGVRVL